MLNSIFLKQYKPTTNAIRFKLKVFNLFFFKKKSNYFFYTIKQTNKLSKKGQKIILSKGKKNLQKSLYSCNMTWTFNYFTLLNTLLVKKKLFGLVKYANGSLSYIHLTHGFFIGSLNFTSNLPSFLWRVYLFSPGSTVIIYFLEKYSIFNNFLIKNKSKIARSSGTFCQIVEVYDDCTVKIRIPSGIKKIISSINFVTVGRCSNIYMNKEIYGKAGSLRYRGLKPKVRGVAMNPVDHPHGGRTKTNKPEVSPWGWTAKHNK